MNRYLQTLLVQTFVVCLFCAVCIFPSTMVVITGNALWLFLYCGSPLVLWFATHLIEVYL